MVNELMTFVDFKKAIMMVWYGAGGRIDKQNGIGISEIDLTVNTGGATGCQGRSLESIVLSSTST